jgi:hypothetical protein
MNHSCVSMGKLNRDDAVARVAAPLGGLAVLRVRHVRRGGAAEKRSRSAPEK